MSVLDCLASWCEGRRPKLIGLPLHARFYSGPSGSAIPKCCHWIVSLCMLWLGFALCKSEAAIIWMGRQERQCATWPFLIVWGCQEHTFSLTKTEGKASHSKAAPLSWPSKVRDRMVAMNEETRVESVTRAHIRGLVLHRILNQEVLKRSQQKVQHYSFAV